MLVELADEEVVWLNARRKEAALRKEHYEKVKACPHTNRIYDGHSHNDDAYKCTACGDIEWR